VAKAKKGSGSSVTIAGWTPDEWQAHMDADEDWTERLEGASEPKVLEAIAALDHGEASVRALACNLVYAIGIEGLGEHASRTVARLFELAHGDSAVKVRNRARIVHEGLAGELERAAIRREMPWLSAYSEHALPKATAGLADPRQPVRLQVYLWWANATGVPSKARAAAIEAIAAALDAETDEITHRAAQIALAHLRGA
jgi:hypothetical protein